MISIFSQLFILLFLSTFRAPVYEKHVETHIKVLLQEIDKQQNTVWKISSEKGLIIYDAENRSKKKLFDSEILVQINNGSVFINNKKIVDSDNLIISSNSTASEVSTFITIDNQSYHGFLYLINYKNSYLLINKLKLEEYVFSVLKTESWPGWSLEINKVLAIACRSYATAKMMEAKRAKLPYHIKPTNCHQTYTGIHFNEILKQATLETSGLIMSYNKSPVLAMFDCCCGGIITAHIKNIQNAKTPYLSRNYACEYCKKCKIFSWKFSISHTEIYEILRKELKSLRGLHDIKLYLDKAGIVEKVVIKDGRKFHTLTGKKFYSLFKGIKSFAFDIKKEQNLFVISGKGYGHHIGLCQWGAHQMVTEGWDHKNILKFYYPGINFVKLACKN